VLIEASRAEVAEIEGRRPLANAVRALAKPGCPDETVSCLAKKILSSTSSLHPVVADETLRMSVSNFEATLEGAAQGDPAACRRAVEMAQKIASGLSVPRGRRVTAASLAHQVLLSILSSKANGPRFTWNEYVKDFTDVCTLATRITFGKPDFSPRAARRRELKRQAQVAASRR
jgi:hypothetical protein